MRPSIRVRALAGVLAPPLFLIVLVGLTIAERGFLRHVGWSAIHRTKVEWPSLLALGHYGWVMVATFAVGGLCGVALATAMWSQASGAAERTAGALVGVMSAAIALEAFRPDSPQSTGAASWHDTLHNAVFPVILVTSLAATVATVFAAWRVGRTALAGVLTLLLACMVAGLALTAVESIAQLARYLYFGALLVWLELEALSMLERERVASRPQPHSPLIKER